jgi:hypothetical protein
MVNFKANITNVKTCILDGIENVVKEVRFEITAEKDGQTLNSFFPVIFDNFTPDNYVSFDKLTEQQVIDWVTEQVGSETIEALKQGLEARFEVATPEPTEIITQEVNLPWVQQPKGASL